VRPLRLSCIGRLGGDAEIRTGKGDIRIAEAVRGTVVLHTEGAVDLNIHATTARGDIDAGSL